MRTPALLGVLLLQLTVGPARAKDRPACTLQRPAKAVLDVSSPLIRVETQKEDAHGFTQEVVVKESGLRARVSLRACYSLSNHYVLEFEDPTEVTDHQHYLGRLEELLGSLPHAVENWRNDLLNAVRTLPDAKQDKRSQESWQICRFELEGGFSLVMCDIERLSGDRVRALVTYTIRP